MPNAALKTIPEIITAASRTTLGILALLIVVVGIIALYFFRNEKAVRYRFFVFLIMFTGTGAFGWSVLIAQREDALRAQTQILPDLKLNLAFSGSEAANPYHSKVSVFVQPNNQLDDEYDSPQYLRADIRPLPGPGGLVIEFRKLAVGDRIYVEVEDHGKKWRSYPMTMLEANLQLNPAEQ